jgi:Rad3-related DNA helicase
MAAQMTKELTAQGVPLKEQGFATFRKLSLPPMITDIRQGAGRLVRTTTDRGVLAILDTRVWSGKTGVAPDPSQQGPRGYGVTVIKALGFTDNWTPDFSYVQAKFRQWQRQQAKATS